jgi:lipoic acid synthetase
MGERGTEGVVTAPPARKKPDWIKVRLGQGETVARVRERMRSGGLHTVCEQAMCPNIGSCWERGRATIMILGGVCTRTCRFCGVTSRKPDPVDSGEPDRVAEAVRAMRLADVVLTSVTRDDLPDGGAAIWSQTIRAVRSTVPGIRLEVLVPDFLGSAPALAQVLDARPDVLGHNLETVPDLYARVRPRADYARSLGVLDQAHRADLVVKTAVMLGLGETESQVIGVMKDARRAGCDILFIGQYLRPTSAHLPVYRYVFPDEFRAYKERAEAEGFAVVVSGPLVRSSYPSDEQANYLARGRPGAPGTGGRP